MSAILRLISAERRVKSIGLMVCIVAVVLANYKHIASVEDGLGLTIDLLAHSENADVQFELWPSFGDIEVVMERAGLYAVIDGELDGFWTGYRKSIHLVSKFTRKVEEIGCTS